MEERRHDFTTDGGYSSKLKIELENITTQKLSTTTDTNKQSNHQEISTSDQKDKLSSIMFEQNGISTTTPQFDYSSDNPVLKTDVDLKSALTSTKKDIKMEADKDKTVTHVPTNDVKTIIQLTKTQKDVDITHLYKTNLHFSTQVYETTSKDMEFEHISTKPKVIDVQPASTIDQHNSKERHEYISRTDRYPSKETGSTKERETRITPVSQTSITEKGIDTNIGIKFFETTSDKGTSIGYGSSNDKFTSTKYTIFPVKDIVSLVYSSNANGKVHSTKQPEFTSRSDTETKIKPVLTTSNNTSGKNSVKTNDEFMNKRSSFTTHSNVITKNKFAPEKFKTLKHLVPTTDKHGMTSDSNKRVDYFASFPEQHTSVNDILSTAGNETTVTPLIGHSMRIDTQFIKPTVNKYSSAETIEPITVKHIGLETVGHTKNEVDDMKTIGIISRKSSNRKTIRPLLDKNKVSATNGPSLGDDDRFKMNEPISDKDFSVLTIRPISDRGRSMKTNGLKSHKKSISKTYVPSSEKPIVIKSKVLTLEKTVSLKMIEPVSKKYIDIQTVGPISDRQISTNTTGSISDKDFITKATTLNSNKHINSTTGKGIRLKTTKLTFHDDIRMQTGGPTLDYNDISTIGTTSDHNISVNTKGPIMDIYTVMKTNEPSLDKYTSIQPNEHILETYTGMGTKGTTSVKVISTQTTGPTLVKDISMEPHSNSTDNEIMSKFSNPSTPKYTNRKTYKPKIGKGITSLGTSVTDDLNKSSTIYPTQTRFKTKITESSVTHTVKGLMTGEHFIFTQNKELRGAVDVNRSNSVTNSDPSNYSNTNVYARSKSPKVALPSIFDNVITNNTTALPMTFVYSSQFSSKHSPVHSRSNNTSISLHNNDSTHASPDSSYIFDGSFISNTTANIKNGTTAVPNISSVSVQTREQSDGHRGVWTTHERNIFTSSSHAHSTRNDRLRIHDPPIIEKEKTDHLNKYITTPEKRKCQRINYSTVKQNSMSITSSSNERDITMSLVGSGGFWEPLPRDLNPVVRAILGQDTVISTVKFKMVNANVTLSLMTYGGAEARTMVR